VRRIVAVTGPKAYEFLRDRERALLRVAEALKAPVEQVERRVAALVDERAAARAPCGRGAAWGRRQPGAAAGRGRRGAGRGAPPHRRGDGVRRPRAQALGDQLRESQPGTVAVLGARLEEGRATLLAVVSDDLRDRGVRADEIVRAVAAVAGGKGGGKPHMAQAGIPDATRLAEALRQAPELVRPLLDAPR
jgi:alanyl-tRNA synthetase